ncbi:MAG: hypothetical protein WC365_04295 [Candidatus Babeliales bacterium]|jgi:hypothetical protein
MTLTSTITKQTEFGDRKVVFGTFTNDSTGGDIETGLRVVEQFYVQHTGSAAVAETPSVYETLPVGDRTSPTIVTTSGKAGIWMAIGY